MDPNIYIQKPLRKVGKDDFGEPFYVYRCDDGSECGGKATSTPMKELKPGWTWVCGDCKGNY